MSDEDVENCLNCLEKYRLTINRYKCASVNFGQSSNFYNKTNEITFERKNSVKNLGLVDKNFKEKINKNRQKNIAVL